MEVSTATETVNIVQSVTASSGGSFISLFWQATIVVKLVMLGLLSASCWSWAIIIYKLRSFNKLSGQTKSFNKTFWSHKPLDELYSIFSKDEAPFPSMFCGLLQEHVQLLKNEAFYGTDKQAFFNVYSERMYRTSSICIAKRRRKLENGLNFLASVGSVSPFVGLFGTVWGIMNSFESIGLEKNASILSVAPGIAEALFATAIGLVVAIPAVLMYNKISSQVSEYIDRLETFSEELMLILSKKIDDRGL